ncbi:hypothetical protein [Nitrosomonas communis]|uniref:Uncharacterized protein n=1 Tax=Nitrosomonas communis TaxID=44574 RepID=A0A1I4S2S3_9PROT|nr:hypothetical protein [Nitrosomonas communis]SFM58739.1 hypothetical protein SAMN05421863_103711 [Nitrosomonas communis]
MARSLAFWLENFCPTDNENEKTEAELHFNYWSLKEEKINYLDIGVRLSKIGQFDSINFYLPFDFNSLKYEPELGKTVCTSDGLISAIFNCPESNIKPNRENGFYDIDFSLSKKEQPIRFFTRLLAENDNSPGGVKITPQDEKDKGCILKFPRNLFVFDDNRDGYFRFRIGLSNEDEKSITTIDKPNWSIVTNHFVESEIIDFRVNESRNLPDKVKIFLTDKRYLKKIHFFLIRDMYSEYKMSHAAYFRCRILESDLWGKYLFINGNEQTQKQKQKQKQKQMLIYHWKGQNNEGIDHFSAFAKFSGRKIHFKQITLVLLFILVLGVLSGLLSNYIWKKLETHVVSSEQTHDSSLDVQKIRNII